MLILKLCFFAIRSIFLQIFLTIYIHADTHNGMVLWHTNFCPNISSVYPTHQVMKCVSFGVDYQTLSKHLTKSLYISSTIFMTCTIYYTISKNPGVAELNAFNLMLHKMITLLENIARPKIMF